MVFVVLTRFGFDEIESRVVVGRDAVWVVAGVLSELEVSRLRDRGWDLTTWSSPVDPSELAEQIETVRLHHPDQVIWAEATTQ